MRRHVLVIRPDNVGDVLLAGPAVRAVAAGAERVTLWVGPRGEAAAALLPGVDHPFVHELPWIELRPAPIDRAWLDTTVDRVAALDVDAAIVCTSFHQSPLPTALLLRAAGVPFVAATSVDHPGALLDVRHRIDDDVHEVERSLSLVRAAGFELPVDDAGRLRIRPLDHVVSPLASGTAWGGPLGRLTDPVSFLSAHRSTGYVVVHPGASVPARSWPATQLTQVVDALVAAGHRVVVTGGPDERKLTAAVAGRSRSRVVDLGGRTDLWELARVLADASVLVAGNSGPVHLAAAVGTPVVELYAPVVPAVRWRPWDVPHVLLGDQSIACAGCRARRCPFEGQPCISDVEVDDVVAAVDGLAAPLERREALTS